MKKRNLFVLLIVTLLASVFALGCKDNTNTPYTPEPYTDFNGIDYKSVVELDSYITLDGVLDEEIWTNSKTTIDIEGATTDQETKKPIDVSVYGERNATVYSYIGEKALYFAFDVTDKNLYYDFYSPQGQNTGVEIYLAKSTQGSFEKGAYSIRICATGEEGKGTFYKVYEPKYYDGVPSRVEESSPAQWREKFDSLGYVDAVAKIDGTVKNSLDVEDYDTSNNTGYVIEIAIDKSIIGGEDANSFVYTAAFCQARGFGKKRLNNSFIPNTSYLNPSTWLLVTNDGHIADKNAYLDVNVVYDTDLATLDGKLDDKLWESAVGRTVVTNVKRSAETGETENVKITSYAVTTPKGVYVGIESNDAYVYFHGNDIHPKYNTGAEVGIAVGKTTNINSKKVRQIRLNVGGKGKRYFGVDNAGESYAYKEGYFPMLMASSVVEGELNTSTAKGWTGEIFVPWSSFGMTKDDYFDGIALFVSSYRGYPSETQSDYFTGMTGNSYSADCNPQEKWYVFENGKPVYDLNLKTTTFDLNDVENGYYDKTIALGFTDTITDRAGYQEIFATTVGGAFGFDEEDGVIVTDNEDGTYRIQIPVTSARNYTDAQQVKFTVNGFENELSVKIKTCYVNYDGVNLFVVQKSGDFYTFDVLITSDESGLNGLTGATFDADYEVTEKGNGVYTFKMPKVVVEANNEHLITVSVEQNGQMLTDTFVLYYDAWSAQELSKVASYLNFNGNITDAKGNTVTAGTGSTPTFVSGTDGQGIKLRNPDKESPSIKNNVNVAKSLGTSDFSMAFDVKLDPNAIGNCTTGAQYELVQSGATVDTGLDTFQISAYDNNRQSIGFRIQLGIPNGSSARVNSYYFNNLGLPTNKWFNLAIVVDRNYTGTTETEEKVAVSVYINGTLRQTNVMSVDKVSGQLQTLGNGNIELGGGFWAWDSGQRYLEMDNFLLYDGFLTQKQINDIATPAKRAN